MKKFFIIFLFGIIICNLFGDDTKYKLVYENGKYKMIPISSPKTISKPQQEARYKLVYENGKYRMIPLVREKITTNERERIVRTKKIKFVPLHELNANTIQAAMYGPLKDKSRAAIIIPQYATTTSFFTIGQYTNPLGANRGVISSNVSHHNLQKLYCSIYEENKENIKKYAREIFIDANRSNARYILYGKDKYGRNVGYVYQMGKENTGVVFYYPDSTKGLFKFAWTDFAALGWNKFSKNFINKMKELNPHLNFRMITEDYNMVLILTYK